MGLRSALGNAALALASVALAALVAECGLALFRPQDRSVWAHTRDGLVVHPPNLETRLADFDQVVRTNSWGMRDREHALEKAPGVFRILLLGDSFMEALQVSFEESLPSLLEARLSGATGRAVEVISPGTSGWGTDDQLAYLTRRGLRFQPDLVLLAMTLHNDVSDNLAREHHDFVDGALVERPPRSLPTLAYAAVRARDFVANHSHLYQLYRRLRATRRSQAVAGALDDHLATLIARERDERTEAGWEMTRQLLDETVAVARAAGADTAVFLIPLFVQVAPEQLDAFVASQGLARDQLDLERPQAVMTAWAGRRGALVIDLLPDFRAWKAQHDAPLYLRTDGHWNREGHALAAEVVARELIARGALDR